MSITSASVTSSTPQLAPQAPQRRSLHQLVSDQDAILRQARQGRWRWPWALLATVAAIVGIASLAGIAYVAFGDVSATDNLLDPRRPSTFLAVPLAFLPLIVVPGLLMRYLHKVWRKLLASTGRFDWQQYFRAAGAFFVATTAFVALDYAIDPRAYHLVHRGIDFLPWLALGFGVIFVQTLAEEILFRGYLLRIWGASGAQSCPTAC